MKKVQTLSVSLPEGVENIRTSEDNTEVETRENYEQYFSLVEASKLSLNDEFLKNTPQTKKQEEFKQMVVEAIKSGLSDFKAQTIDPSVDENGKIYYKPGSKPGIGYSPNWWHKNAIKVVPGKSRQGTTVERIVFLAVLIKSGLATLEQICDHSEEIGHYRDSEDAKYDFEETGSRPVGEFYDLGNTCKITENKEDGGFSFVGGDYYNFGSNYPLANVGDVGNPCNNYYYGVGWLVF